MVHPGIYMKHCIRQLVALLRHNGAGPCMCRECLESTCLIHSVIAAAVRKPLRPAGRGR